MNKQELIERIEGLKNIFGNKCEYVKIDFMIELVSELDEPKSGHADEAPRYVKNILARLRELPDHDREVWLKAIMGEFEQDFSHAKWREGYEQGKFEGEWAGQQLKDADQIRQELNRPVVQQFVADWIEYCKVREITLAHALYYSDEAKNKSVFRWLFEDSDNQETFALAWILGYEIEKEKRYYIRLKGVDENYNYLNFIKHLNAWALTEIKTDKKFRTTHTRKELEEAGFGWIFSCEGIEVEEVE